MERARAALGLDRSVPARARLVRRLDRPGADYFLVTLGTEEACVGVVTLDARTGETRSSASLPGVRPCLGVDEEKARAIAGGLASAELVWKPSAASRSPLYPVWQVPTANGPVYVDQQGRLWSDLAAATQKG